MERQITETENVFFTRLLAPQIAGQAATFFEAMLAADDAHALMLLDQGILTRDEAGRLLTFSRDLAARGAGSLELSPEREDLYLNIEAHLIAELGDYVGGKLHTGRSRNDLYAAVQRIKCRETILRLADLSLGLRAVLLEVAEANLTTVIPGYTHLQPAQPITFGYHLAALGHAFARDFERLAAAYAKTNRNPLGACALAGTGFPIDRAAVGRYLGFDGEMANALDAVASRDYVADTVFALTMLLSDIGRGCQDFYVWTTAEFGFVKLPDAFVVGSSIMPQKRNPIVFEHCIGKVSHLLGSLVSVVTAMKAAPYTHSRATSGEVFTTLWAACEEAETAIELMTAALEKIEIDADAALDNTRRNFSTATEIADEIARRMDVSFRTAYRIVKAAVLPLYRRGGTSEDLTLEELNRAAVEVLGHPLRGLSAADVETALSPSGNVEKRSVPGGPAPATVAEDIAAMRLGLQADARRLSGWREKVASAERARKERISEIVGA